ncbi:MAG TPA: DUF1844 domain-containing protein [Deltaproteobacteria bacterium]|nr:DUF1844 domain-containing protein [Deltaproteobacteria bacterium]
MTQESPQKTGAEAEAGGSGAEEAGCGAAPSSAGAALPPASFTDFILSLSTSALVSLGEMDNPLTKKKEKDAAAARHTIDLVALLQEKTKGNLTREEDAFLTQVLTDLRLRYARVFG